MQDENCDRWLKDNAIEFVDFVEVHFPEQKKIYTFLKDRTQYFQIESDIGTMESGIEDVYYEWLYNFDTEREFYAEFGEMMKQVFKI